MFNKREVVGLALVVGAFLSIRPLYFFGFLAFLPLAIGSFFLIEGSIQSIRSNLHTSDILPHIILLIIGIGPAILVTFLIVNEVLIIATV